MKAQVLLAAYGAEVRLKQEMEREPLAQSRPEEPSQQEVDNHALAPEPFQSGCALCTRYRSQQDPHPVSSHESVGHSVLSLDFGYCCRMEDESDSCTTVPPSSCTAIASCVMASQSLHSFRRVDTI